MLSKEDASCPGSHPYVTKWDALNTAVDKFLHTNHLAVARLCDMIACRRVEMLLAENVQVNIQLNKFWGEMQKKPSILVQSF